MFLLTLIAGLVLRIQGPPVWFSGQYTVADILLWVTVGLLILQVIIMAVFGSILFRK